MKSHRNPPHVTAPLSITPQLRHAAEAELKRAPASAATPAQSTAEILHELQVHRIELEMQNETLRQTQIALEESRDHYVDLYEFAPLGYLTLTRDGLITTINLSGAELLGSERKHLLQRRFSLYVAANDQDLWHEHFLHAWRQGGKHRCELSLQKVGGAPFFASLDFLLTTGSRAVPMLRIALTDITERRLALAQLSAANRCLEILSAGQAAHLREIAAELTHAEQHERDRLHERLHDTVQPLLVAARLSLSSISLKTTAADSLRIASEACAHISQIMQMARDLSLQLCPPLIREGGLHAALESLCHWVKTNHALNVELSRAPAAEPDDMAIRLICFNAVRELLMNAVKHAATAQVRLSLRCVDRDRLCIVVADHGSGFDPRLLTQGSGLAAIRRRLDMLGGALQIDSHPGHGTVATLTIPLHSIHDAEDAHRNRENNDAQDTHRR